MSEDPNNWNNKTGSFIKRPGKGWLHPDEKLERDEVIYPIKVSYFFLSLFIFHFKLLN